MVEGGPFHAGESFRDFLEIEKLREQFAGYVPPWEAKCALCHEALELAQDYLTLAHIYEHEWSRGRFFLVLGVPTEAPAERMKKVRDAAHSLIDMVREVDTLALGTEDESGAERLGREWPRFRWELDKHRNMVEIRGPLRGWAQACGISLTEEEVARVKGGAPVGPRDFQSGPLAFFLSVKMAMDDVKTSKKRETRDSVGAAWLARLGREGRDGAHSYPGQALMRTANFFGVRRWKELKEKARQA
jgi:hypothetical protein